MLVLPGDPLFLPTLATPPPTQGQPYCNFICRAGSDVLEVATQKDLDEYLEGGEYDERLSQINQNQIDYDGEDDQSLLYLPDSIEFIPY